MNISNISLGLTELQKNDQIGIAVLSKAMDTNESLGEGLVNMIDSAAMERSVNPHIGGNVDFYA
ncbi:MAG: YjfB family protein [Lachnospiraceae bacterium]|jgi:hypothetical protein|nr:YjfB family protein [Lachnospiraceae bacterium]